MFEAPGGIVWLKGLSVWLVLGILAGIFMVEFVRDQFDVLTGLGPLVAKFLQIVPNSSSHHDLVRYLFWLNDVTVARVVLREARLPSFGNNLFDSVGLFVIHNEQVKRLAISEEFSGMLDLVHFGPIISRPSHSATRTYTDIIS